MTRFGIALAGLLAGTLITSPLNLAAQVSAHPAVGSPILNEMGESCPVDLQVQRRAMHVLVTTGDHRTIPAALRLRLDWANRREKEIVAAAIVAHGFNAEPRVIPAGSPVSPELKKVLAVKLDIGRDGRTSTLLDLQHFATVSFIDLKSIEYGDGTRWIAPGERSCGVAPNPLLLVNASTPVK